MEKKIKKKDIESGCLLMKDGTRECFGAVITGVYNDKDMTEKEIEKEIFEIVYTWGRIGVKTDEKCNTFQRLIKQLCHQSKKELLEKKDKEIRQYAYDWADEMWEINAFNPDKWEGEEEEVYASIVSYLEGHHLPLK